jgi:precorrin-2 dehydrogenase/sirohydrochlorin ferrochelatase
MTYYPVFLRLGGERCVVIGGGEVAERKVETLLEAGAKVTVVSPTLTPGLAEWLARGEIAHVRRPYQDGDLAGARLAYAATDDQALHAELAAAAAAAGALLNVVDVPQWCSFIVPSIMRRGSLTVAVSTGGGSPALARRARQEIEGALGPEWERALDVLARLRQHLQACALPSDERQRILRGLVASDLLVRLRQPDRPAVDRLLAEHVGADVSLASLGAEL